MDDPYTHLLVRLERLEQRFGDHHELMVKGLTEVRHAITGNGEPHLGIAFRLTQLEKDSAERFRYSLRDFVTHLVVPIVVGIVVALGTVWAQRS